MELENGEYHICPAIWVDDKKQYENQPININTGYVVYGFNEVDILKRMRQQNVRYLNISNNKVYLSEFHDGYYTNKRRFIEKHIKY